MNDLAKREAENEQYLQAALTWLRLRLQHLITPTETIDLTEAIETITTHETADPPPPLVILSQRFGLSRFEQETLLLCVAMELDAESTADEQIVNDGKGVNLVI